MKTYIVLDCVTPVGVINARESGELTSKFNKLVESYICGTDVTDERPVLNADYQLQSVDVTVLEPALGDDYGDYTYHEFHVYRMNDDQVK